MKNTKLILLFFICLGSACTQSWTFTLHNSSNSSIKGPIFLDIPEDVGVQKELVLTNVQKNISIPIQHIEGNNWVFILAEEIQAGEKLELELSTETGDAAFETVSLHEQDGVIKIQVGGKPVLNYHVKTQLPPRNEPGYYKRSGFIHPLYSPNGQILTDDFPLGHVHQHGIFYAWVRTNFMGKEIDFWNQQKKTGTVRHVEVISARTGPVYAEFSTKLEHIAYVDSQETVALEETWKVRIYNQAESFVIDLFSEQVAGEEPLTMETYHYGGFGFRGAATWFDDTFEQDESDPQNYLGEGKGGFSTSEGNTRMDGNHTRPVWVDAHGYVDGEPVGATIMGHPSNFRFPQPVRLHPVMPYFCFAPSVLGEFSITSEPYLSAYRLVSHQGHRDKQSNDADWALYKKDYKITWNP